MHYIESQHPNQHQTSDSNVYYNSVAASAPSLGTLSFSFGEPDITTLKQRIEIWHFYLVEP